MVKFNRFVPRDVPRLGTIMAPEANSFGVLRLAMASLVLISHSFLYSYGTSDGEPLTAWTGHSLGEHAVQVFFILSGILVAQSLDRSRSLVDFAIARVLRIFPALIVCVVLTALAFGPFVSSFDAATYFSSSVLPAYLVKTLSLSTGNAPLPGVFTTLPLAGGVNTSLWTLKYEVLCYAGLAVAGSLGLFNPRWRNIAAVALAAFLALVFTSEPKAAETFTFTDNVRYFALFFGTGVLAYLIRDVLRIHGLVLIPLAAAFVLAEGSRFEELATALFFGYGVVWAASKSFGPLRRWCNKIDMSFGVYIFAGPIEQALVQALPGPNPIVVSLIAALIVLPLALLSWVFIEHPALALRHTLRQRAKPRPARQVLA